jgi:hypothetical protein
MESIYLILCFHWIFPSSLFFYFVHSVKPDGTLQIDNVQPADAGEFECEALNTVGTASTSVRLKVRGK